MKKNKKQTQLPFRLNILFFVIFILFSLLIFQLGIVQILDGEAFQEEIDRTIQETTKIPVPRGKIVDKYNNVLVDNKPLYSITYTPPKGVQAEDKLKVAEELAAYISMDDKEMIDRLTDRNKQEYWYLKNQEEADSWITDEEIEELSNVEQYNEILERIPEEELDKLTDEELEVIAIKKELDKAYSLTPQIVKSGNVSPEEYARVAEHLDSLPGINATTDWDREYPYGDTFRTFLGSITSQEQGIPAEKEQYYLTKGYSRNDRVGKSGLEEQYEDLLRGRKEEIHYTTTKSGKVIDSKVVVQGERGKDLMLTIDIELQKRLDKIVLDELKKTKQKYPHPNRHLTDAIAVAINPQTGELLAVSGQHYNEDGEYENAGYKALYDAHRPGSSIKGATVLAGYNSGVISQGQTFYDRPLKLRGSNAMSSYGGGSLGSVNDLSALERSSNVYMYYIALRIGGEYRNPFPNDGSPTFNVEAYQEMRNYFSQLGLGINTGVDYPFESTGYKGATDSSVQGLGGLFLQFAIGQYDTYTTLQLAQYVSTIANDGKRVRPHFLKNIHEPTPNEGELGSIYKSINPELLNRVDMSQSEIERVQEGFYRAFRGSQGTGRSYWAGKSYNAVGKTGTAQNDLFKDGVRYETENLTLVGYAPYDNPEIAFAVVVPNLGNRSGDAINHRIGTRLMDTYFELKKERDQEAADD